MSDSVNRDLETKHREESASAPAGPREKAKDTEIIYCGFAYNVSLAVGDRQPTPCNREEWSWLIQSPRNRKA